VVDHGGEPLIESLALVAPGTPLRDGLDRILQAKRGALVVVGDDPVVLSICTGGFLLDAEFSPQRIAELAKMDGAIILAPDASRIARANVHLVPRASIPTSETGTRHRTAERVARSIDVPVITVSEAMATVTVFRHARKHTLQRTGRLVDRATQAVSTVQRFKTRFDFALDTLSTLEVEDAVSVRDVVAVLQPGEMVVRIAEEIGGYLVELGEDGRLIRLQLEELGAGLDESLRLVVLDYVATPAGARPSRPSTDGHAERRSGREQAAEHALSALHALSAEQLLDQGQVAAALGLGADNQGIDAGLEARGYRLLHRLPRVSDVIVERIVERFATLPRIMQASLGDLEQVGGVGEAKARSVKDGLARLAEASILERYQ
jgi:diadenylate cyclase